MLLSGSDIIECASFVKVIILILVFFTIEMIIIIFMIKRWWVTIWRVLIRVFKEISFLKKWSGWVACPSHVHKSTKLWWDPLINIQSLITLKCIILYILYLTQFLLSRKKFKQILFLSMISFFIYIFSLNNVYMWRRSTSINDLLILWLLKLYFKIWIKHQWQWPRFIFQFYLNFVNFLIFIERVSALFYILIIKGAFAACIILKTDFAKIDWVYTYGSFWSLAHFAIGLFKFIKAFCFLFRLIYNTLEESTNDK